MGKQLKRGTQFPIRPTFGAIARPGSAFTLPRDTPAVDWTAAGTKITIATLSKIMDDPNAPYIAIDDAADEVDLRAGIWLVEFMPTVTNTDAANNEQLRFAITNAAGTTVLKESASMVIKNASPRQLVQFRTAIHLTADTSVCIRGAQVTDTGGADDIQVVATIEDVLYFTRIGNQNEA